VQTCLLGDASQIPSRPNLRAQFAELIICVPDPNATCQSLLEAVYTSPFMIKELPAVSPPLPVSPQDSRRLVPSFEILLHVISPLAVRQLCPRPSGEDEIVTVRFLEK